MGEVETSIKVIWLTAGLSNLVCSLVAKENTTLLYESSFFLFVRKILWSNHSESWLTETSLAYFKSLLKFSDNCLCFVTRILQVKYSPLRAGYNIFYTYWSLYISCNSHINIYTYCATLVESTLTLSSETFVNTLRTSSIQNNMPFFHTN